MSNKLPKANYQGDLKIGDIKIPCAVLEDGTRILRERSVARALGKKGGGTHWQRKKMENGALLPEYVSAKYLEPYIEPKIRESLINPIIYETKQGTEVQGVSATLLPEICDIWLKARENGALSPAQEKTAKKAEILVRSFAQIGIIALVDEATGYQDVRTKEALQAILDKFLRKELAAWAKKFPDEFYKEMFRLRGWQWKGMHINRPSVVGKYTNDIVYERLAPGILEELQKKNPKDSKGRRKSKHFQWLTEDVGHPALAQHLHAVIGLMRASTNWRNFNGMLQRAFPKRGTNLELPFTD